ncbi:MAG: ISAzo13 family transposase [Thermocrispum sp.]
MGAGVDVDENWLAAVFEQVGPHLDERQRRLLAGAHARALGHGGIAAVSRACGMRGQTVSRGVRELDAGGAPLGRVRAPGAGRKRLAETDPGLVPALLALIEPAERGDPVSPLRWTTKSTRALAAELTARGHRVSADTVSDLLHEQGFSLQANAKMIEGTQHPDRDGQFRYVNEQVSAHLQADQPVVSVDTKKKEQIGEFANGGREWRPAKNPVRVCDHDFSVRAEGAKVAPYGIYDLAANTGWVNVGTDHDTAVFAVESVRRWWRGAGAGAYPGADRLLITADAGGSNSYRSRVFKAELAALAADTGLTITVCHFPPGTSKWNKIEHRLFSHITHNWRARPLTSHEVVVNTIAATTTRTGLRVHAELDTGTYPLGVKISDEQMAALPLHRHDWHGEWNYTLDPHQPPPPPAPVAPTQPPRRDSDGWAAPALTGMSTQDFNTLVEQLVVPYTAYREAELHVRRGGPSWRKPAGGHPPAFTLSEMLLITVLRARFRTPQHVLAELFGVSTPTIAKAERQLKTLLDQRKHTITPTGTRLRTLTELTDYAASHGITLTPGTKAAR